MAKKPGQEDLYPYTEYEGKQMQLTKLGAEA